MTEEIQDSGLDTPPDTRPKEEVGAFLNNTQSATYFGIKLGCWLKWKKQDDFPFITYKVCNRPMFCKADFDEHIQSSRSSALLRKKEKNHE